MTSCHTIKEYLSVNPDIEDELLEPKEARSRGSCMWFMNGEDFHRWLDEDSNTRYFWLKGPPATGKSIMVAHVIDQLDSCRCNQFYFQAWIAAQLQYQLSSPISSIPDGEQQCQYTRSSVQNQVMIFRPLVMIIRSFGERYSCTASYDNGQQKSESSVPRTREYC